MKGLEEAHELVQLERRIRRLYGMERITHEQHTASMLCIRLVRALANADGGRHAAKEMLNGGFPTFVERVEKGWGGGHASES